MLVPNPHGGEDLVAGGTSGHTSYTKLKYCGHQEVFYRVSPRAGSIEDNSMAGSIEDNSMAGSIEDNSMAGSQWEVSIK